LDILRKKAVSLNIKYRFSELQDFHETTLSVMDKNTTSDLEPEFEARLKWWELILSGPCELNEGFDEKEWFAKLDRALGEMPYTLLKHTGKEARVAELILKNIFQFLNYKPVYAGKHIDWNDNPFGDREWTTCMNRHSFLLNLEQQYSVSGDKKYAEKSKELFLDWACSQPIEEWNNGRYAWSSLNAGIRGIVWPKIFCMWNKANMLTGPFKTAAMNILIKNAEFLMKFKNPGPSNWRIFEAQGLFCMALIFPGLKQAVRWRNEAVKRLKFEMVRQIRRDGCHFQNCPGYHQGMLRAFYTVSILAKRLQIKNLFNDKVFLRTVEKMCEFSMYTADPDFKTLPIGDSGISDITESFAECNELFDRNDFKYILSKRKKGILPRKTSCLFKSSGHVIFRSDWSRSARFMLFDLAEHMGCHSHYDVFNIHAWAYGRELICDSGRSTYRQEDKQMMQASSRHNTVTVDNKNQNLLLPVPHKFKTQKNWGFVQAESFNYDGVKYIRAIIFIDGKHWIVIDSLHSCSIHDYTLNFHILQKKAFLNKQELIMPNMIINCSSDVPVKSILEPSVIGRDYNKVLKGQVLRYMARAQNVRFVTLLATYEEQRHPVCQMEIDYDSVIKIKAGIGNKNYQIDYSENKAGVNIYSPADGIIAF